MRLTARLSLTLLAAYQQLSSDQGSCWALRNTNANINNNDDAAEGDKQELAAAAAAAAEASRRSAYRARLLKRVELRSSGISTNKGNNNANNNHRVLQSDDLEEMEGDAEHNGITFEGNVSEYEYGQPIHITAHVKNSYIEDEALARLDPDDTSGWTFGVYMRMARPQGGTVPPVVSVGVVDGDYDGLAPGETKTSRRKMRRRRRLPWGYEDDMNMMAGNVDGIPEDMTGLEDMMGFENMTGLEDMMGLEDMTGLQDMTDDPPKLDFYLTSTLTATDAKTLSINDYGESFGIFLLDAHGAKILGPATFTMVETQEMLEAERAAAEHMAAALQVGPAGYYAGTIEVTSQGEKETEEEDGGGMLGLGTDGNSIIDVDSVEEEVVMTTDVDHVPVGETVTVSVSISPSGGGGRRVLGDKNEMEALLTRKLREDADVPIDMMGGYGYNGDVSPEIMGGYNAEPYDMMTAQSTPAGGDGDVPDDMTTTTQAPPTDMTNPTPTEDWQSETTQAPPTDMPNPTGGDGDVPSGMMSLMSGGDGDVPDDMMSLMSGGDGDVPDDMMTTQTPPTDMTNSTGGNVDWDVPDDMMTGGYGDGPEDFNNEGYYESDDGEIDISDLTLWSLGVFMRNAHPQGGTLSPILAIPLLCSPPNDCDTADVDDGYLKGTYLVNTSTLNILDTGSGYDIWVLDGTGAGVGAPIHFNIDLPK